MSLIPVTPERQVSSLRLPPFVCSMGTTVPSCGVKAGAGSLPDHPNSKDKGVCQHHLLPQRLPSQRRRRHEFIKEGRV